MHPLQKDCPRNDPKKHAAWCWAAGVPDPGPMRPNPIPLVHPMLCETISQMLWDFGFRHDPAKQTRWIEGVAGLGTMAKVVDKQPAEDPIEKLTEEFLSAENPKLLETIRKAPKESREKLIRDLEKNFEVLSGLLEMIKGI